MLATPRALYAFGQDGLLPSGLARLHPGFQTPHVAIAVYATLIFGVAASSRFKELADRVVVMLLVLYLVTCAASWWLEQRDFRGGDGSPLSFRGANLVPLVAMGIVGWLLTTAARADLLVAACTMGVATVLYFLSMRRRARFSTRERTTQAEKYPVPP
jgi:amino acid transporter